MEDKNTIELPTVMRVGFLKGLGAVAAKAKMPINSFVTHVRNGRFGRVVQIVGRALETKVGTVKRNRLWSVQRAR